MRWPARYSSSVVFRSAGGGGGVTAFGKGLASRRISEYATSSRPFTGSDARGSYGSTPAGIATVVEKALAGPIAVRVERRTLSPAFSTTVAAGWTAVV